MVSKKVDGCEALTLACFFFVPHNRKISVEGSFDRS